MFYAIEELSRLAIMVSPYTTPKDNPQFDNSEAPAPDCKGVDAEPRAGRQAEKTLGHRLFLGFQID